MKHSIMPLRQILDEKFMLGRPQGKTLAINPGKCGGWLPGRSTIALADLDQMSVEIVKPL